MLTKTLSGHRGFLRHMKSGGSGILTGEGVWQTHMAGKYSHVSIRNIFSKDSLFTAQLL